MLRLDARASTLACTLALFVAASEADAQRSYHTLNLGGRATGMGTAYTGIADDGTAAYYNPGGLGLGRTTRVDANVTLNSFERLKIDDYFRAPGGSEGLTEKSDPSIPIFASISTTFGKKDELGERPFVLVFSAFTLERLRVGGDVRVTDESGRTSTVLYDRSFRSPYYGLSLGHRVRGDLGWGVSGFFVPRSLSHQETIDLPFGGVPSPEAPYFEGASSVNRNSRLSIRSYDLVFRVGVLKRFGRFWSVGVTAQPPGWRLWRETELRFQLSAVDGSADPSEATFVFFEESGKTSMPIPWEIRAGAAYGPRGRVTVSLDVQVVGWVTQRDIFTVDPAEGVEDRVPPTGVFFDARGRRKMVANVYLGSDVQIAREVYLRSGFLTNFDPDPEPHPTSDVYESPRIHRYGFTLNAAIHRKRRWLQAGLAALFGSGYASGLDAERALAGDSPFFRTQARSRLFLLSITAANDFGRLAQESIEGRLERWREKKGREGEEGEERDD